MLKSDGIEEVLLLLWRPCLFPLSVHFGWHADDRFTLLTIEINVEGFCEIGYFRVNHVRRLTVIVDLITVLTFVIITLKRNLLFTCVIGTSQIENSVDVFESRDIAVNGEEMLVISVNLISKLFFDFTNELYKGKTLTFTSQIHI